MLPLEALERRGSVGGALKLHQRLALALHAARQSQAAGGESPLSVLSRRGETTPVFSGRARTCLLKVTIFWIAPVIWKTRCTTCPPSRVEAVAPCPACATVPHTRPPTVLPAHRRTRAPRTPPADSAHKVHRSCFRN